MRAKFLKYILILITITLFFQKNVYSDSLITSLQFENYEINYYNQNFLKPNLSSPTSNPIANASLATEAFIIKNGKCVAYKPMDADDITGWQNKDGTPYTSSTNFYLHDMDYSVCVFKYTFNNGSLYVNETTAITRKYKTSGIPEDTIPYSATNKITKDIDNTGINEEDYTCFYYDNDGKTLYIQYVTEFPEITLLNEFNATYTFDFDNTSLEGKLTIPDAFKFKGSSDGGGINAGILADSSQLKYSLTFDINNSGNTDSLVIYAADDTTYTELNKSDVDPDTYDRLWCTFQIIPKSPYVCLSDNAKFILNGVTYQNPIDLNGGKCLFIHLSEYSTIDKSIDNTYGGYVKNLIINESTPVDLGGGFLIQFCVNKNDTPIIDPPSPNTSNDSSGHQVLNTGVN